MMQTASEALREKYGDEALIAGQRLGPATFERQLALRDSLDQHFARLRIDFKTLGLGRRNVLDGRTRLLVLAGQFTIVRNATALEDTIRAAIAAQVPPREVLEIILQCAVYGGDNVVDPALEVFARVAEELGVLDEIRDSQLPLDGRDRERELAAELATWHPDDLSDPRREDLMARHGWLGVSTGLRLRPKHHLNILAYLDALDPEFADLWLKFCYQGMYSRGIVDDRTRLLCMVGDCIAAGEATQARAHMRGAMRNGATPREVLEVIFQSCVNFGMPPMLRALRILVSILAEDGRLAEIGNPPDPVE